MHGSCSFIQENVHITIFNLWVLLLLTAAPGLSQVQAPALYIQNGSFAFQSTSSDSSYNQNKPFIPASTLKLLTSLAALNILGPEYRFTTTIYLTQHNDLCIYGGGDPFLTSEAITRLATQLKAKGITTIQNLIVDSSDYNTPEPPEGANNSSNPYDTRNGALAVNFNSLPLLKLNQQVVSSEKQTPTIPLMREIGGKLTYGKHRVNVWAYSGGEDISIRYTKELFAAIFSQEQIRIKGKVLTGSIQNRQHPFYVYESDKTLIEMLRLCLKYSSNYIANQIFLEIGKYQYGSPATWQKSRQAMSTFISSHFAPPFPVMVEGSGLSRQNRISAKQMIKVLVQLKPWADDIINAENGILVKSGTLSGVYCYAGYFKYFTRLFPFAILLNQKDNSRDKLLNILHQQFFEHLHHENPSSSQPAP